jgi:hypothetical protein
VIDAVSQMFSLAICSLSASWTRVSPIWTANNEFERSAGLIFERTLATSRRGSER